MKQEDASSRWQSSHADDDDGDADDDALDDDEKPTGPVASPSLSGWLTLESGGVTDSGSADSKSKKRWCVLKRAFLFYAGTNKDCSTPRAWST